jgi:hypothetical protein
MTAPAVAAIGYTVCSVNNAFDRNLHGVMGFTDSPAMILMICAFMMTQMSGPLFMLACIPFFFDGFVSTLSACKALQGQATVTEIADNQENFISADDADGEQVERMISPSEAVLPASLQEPSQLNSLLTSNWRDNAYREDNSISKQLGALLMIAGYMFFGTKMLAEGDGSFTPVAAGSLAYAASGIAGYFGVG